MSSWISHPDAQLSERKPCRWFANLSLGVVAGRDEENLIAEEGAAECRPPRVGFGWDFSPNSHFAALWAWIAPVAAQNARTPRFEDYPVSGIFHGTPAAPIFATSPQQRYRTRIRNGVLKGEGVMAGSETKKFLAGPGANFAGNYVVITWGCGSQCVMMAIVDAATGKIYDPPLSGAGTELHVPLDNLSKMETAYRIDSSLMILRNACRDFKDRKTCGTYYFNWNDHFDLVKFCIMDPLKDKSPGISQNRLIK